MKSVMILMILIMLVNLFGCSNEKVLFNDNSLDKICREDIIKIADEDKSPVLDPDGIIVNVAAQILESAYYRYKNYGMTEADFERLPDGNFKDNLKALYYDMSAILDKDYEY